VTGIIAPSGPTILSGPGDGITMGSWASELPTRIRTQCRCVFRHLETATQCGYRLRIGTAWLWNQTARCGDGDPTITASWATTQPTIATAPRWCNGRTTRRPQLRRLNLTQAENSAMALSNLHSLTLPAHCSRSQSQPISRVINWTPLGGPEEISPGHFQFTDYAAKPNPTAFYRTASP
jgi:hypothetical protein